MVILATRIKFSHYFLIICVEKRSVSARFWQVGNVAEEIQQYLRVQEMDFQSEEKTSVNNRWILVDHFVDFFNKLRECSFYPLPNIYINKSMLYCYGLVETGSILGSQCTLLLTGSWSMDAKFRSYDVQDVVSDVNKLYLLACPIFSWKRWHFCEPWNSGIAVSCTAFGKI